MNLIAVCRVMNEGDIIEAFVRHHCVHFNKLIILDDGSTDNTLSVLRLLEAEGLPLVVLTGESFFYDQARQMTSLLRMAVDKFGADWIMPLDADEFVEPAGEKLLADVIAVCRPLPFSVAWSNFVWTDETHRDPKSNPVLRLRSRLPPCPISKVFVPASYVDEHSQLAQGNHNLMRDGEIIPSTPQDAIQLCHFPIRSLEQYAGKIAIGYLKYAALADWDRQLGFHYIEPFKSLMAGGLNELEQRMAADSRNYGFSNCNGPFPEAKYAPLAYQGGDLVFTSSRTSLIQNILKYTESLAKELALVGGSATKVPLSEL
jgi:glycosyltransferase involved in cell wall biosynthesis